MAVNPQQDPYKQTQPLPAVTGGVIAPTQGQQGTPQSGAPNQPTAAAQPATSPTAVSPTGPPPLTNPGGQVLQTTAQQGTTRPPPVMLADLQKDPAWVAQNAASQIDASQWKVDPSLVASGAYTPPATSFNPSSAEAQQLQQAGITNQNGRWIDSQTGRDITQTVANYLGNQGYTFNNQSYADHNAFAQAVQGQTGQGPSVGADSHLNNLMQAIQMMRAPTDEMGRPMLSDHVGSIYRGDAPNTDPATGQPVGFGYQGHSGTYPVQGYSLPDGTPWDGSIQSALAYMAQAQTPQGQLTSGGGGQQPGSVPIGGQGGQGVPSGNTSYGPGDDLRGTQINPTTDPRLQMTMDQVNQARDAVSSFQGLGQFQGVDSAMNPQVQAMLNQAGGEIGNMNIGQYGSVAPGTYEDTPEALRARELTMSALEQMMGGPNRADLAAQALGLFDERSAEAQQRALTSIGESAARYGRLGSGGVTTQIGEYELARQRDRDQLQRELALGAADAELGDRATRLGAGLGAGGQFRSEDLATAGFQQGLRNEERGERQFDFTADLARAGLAGDRASLGQSIAGQQFGMDQSLRNEQRTERNASTQHSLADLQSRLGVMGALSGLEGQQFGQGLSNRNELRGERDFQNNMQQQALNDYIRQIMLQDQLQNSEFGRDQSRINSLLAAGFAGDPTNALLGASQQQAGSGMDIGSLLYQWAMQQGQS